MNRNQDLNTTIKEHFKMYKAGKVWLVAGLTLSFLSLGSSSLSAHADSIAQSGESSQTDGGSQSTAMNSVGTSTASVTSQKTVQVSQTAFIATSLSVSQSQSISTSQSKSDSTSVSTSQSQSNSDSVSTSQSQSTSTSVSTSQSQLGVAGSTTNQSQSVSASVSASQSLALVQGGQGQANSGLITSQSTQMTAQAGTTEENVSALSLGATAVTPDALAQSNLAEQGTVLGDSSTTSQSSSGSQTSTSPAPTAVQSMADDQTARSQFNSTVASNTASQSNQVNPSSITISQSDQLTNIDQYKAQDQANNSYAAVTDWASFQAAYLNDNIRFIDIQNDITNPNAGNYNDLSERTQNIIIQGNGHQLNLGQAAMWTGVSPNAASNGTGGSTFTITNTNLVQYDAWNSTSESGVAWKGSYPNAAIASYNQNNSDGGWIYNIDNVSLNGPQGITGPANQQPEHLLDAEGSYAIFSGNVTVNSTQEMARISKVDIVNGANVNFQLANGANVTSNTGDGSPMFNFSSLATAQSQGSAITGADHMFRVGDGASVSGGFYHSGAAAPGLFNYGLVYGSYQGMEIGDNVTWTLDGYRHLLDQLNYNGSNPNNRQYIFGRNFTVNTLNNQDNLSGVTAFDGRDFITTSDNTNANIYFYPGLTLSFKQFNTQRGAQSIKLGAGTTLEIDEPRLFHVGLFDSNNNGYDYAGGVDNIGGFNGQIFTMSNGAQFIIKGVKTSIWTTGTSSGSNPTASDQTDGGTLVITNQNAVLTPRDGDQNSTITVKTDDTREIWADNTGGNGAVNVDYVDETGKVVKEVQVDVSDLKKYYPGEVVSLVNSNIVNDQMPTGYRWALGSEIPSTAAGDHQSGGDSTTSADDGTADGQANNLIVPVNDMSFTYKVYVYGLPETVQYQYVDENTGKVLPGQLSGGTGSELTSGLMTANYGNTIDWTNQYYTTTNVPTGYHYDASNTNQTKSTVVSDNNGLVTIYVAGNAQNIQPVYENQHGNTLRSVPSLTIQGITGQTLASLPQPEVDGFSIYQTQVNGQVVDPTKPYTFGPSDQITFLYETNADRITDLSALIYAEETKENGIINNDSTLNRAVKASQVSQVGDARQAALTKLSAGSGNALNDIFAQGIAAIDAVYHTGLPIETQRADCLTNLQAVATKTETTIKNDTTLTTAQVASETAAVEADLQAGQTAIKSATDIDGIYDPFNNYSTKIQADYKTGEAISGQKSDANNAINGAGNQTHQDINNDPTIDTATKTAENNAVTKANSNALINIQNAQTAQQVADALANGLAAIKAAHVSGTPLTQQQSAEEQAVQQAAHTATGIISGDQTLTKSDQDAQNQKVYNFASAAITAISNAQDAQSIETLANTAIQNINAVHQSGPAVGDQLAAAIAKLNAEALKVTNAINTDPTLTTAKQQQESAGVTAAQNTALNLLNSQTTAQGIQQQLSDGVLTIDNQHQSGDDLTQQKNDANNALASQASATTTTINQDVTLTAAQKQQQKLNVQSALTADQALVTNATNAQGVLDKKTAGLADIAGQYQAGEAISQQQNDAINALDQQRTTVESAINIDPTLTTSTRQAQDALVEADFSNAKNAVNNATDADDINAARDQWKQKLASEHVSGEALANQQADKSNALSVLAGQVKQQIEADTGLTGAQQQAQSNNVDQDLQKAESALTATTDADGVNSTNAQWTQKINSDYQKATQTLAEQQSTINSNLAALAVQVKTEIKADAGLTSSQQTDQAGNVDSDLTRAQAAVSATTNADGANSANSTWTQKINADYQAGVPLATQQTSASTNLATLHDQLVTAVKADTGLTSAAQTSDIQNLDAHLIQAQTAVKTATNADGVNSAVAIWQQTLNADYKKGESLSDEQIDAKNQLTQLAGQVKQQIENDTGLTGVTQQQQTSNVTADLASALNAVLNAKDDDDVNAAVSTWTTKLNGDYTAGIPLANQQETAIASLKATASQANAKITGDTGLTGADQQSQSGQVNTDEGKAIAAINAATNADGVNSAEASWTQTINNIYKAGTPLSQQQETANQNFSTLAGQLKGQIDGDASLTTAQKQSDDSNLQADLTKAQVAVSAATNADGVNTAVSTWTPLLKADYQTYGTLAEQQSAANDQLTKVAGQVKAEITGDTGLTTADQNSQSAKVDNDLASAFASLVNLAGQIKNRIKADTGLTSAAQGSQSNRVDSDLSQAQTAINATKNADDLNNTVTTWTGTLNDEYKAGEALSDQQESANNQLAVLANQVKVQIEADTGLTSAEQQAQSKQVDTDLASAQTAVSSATSADGVNSAVTTWTGTLNADHKVGQALSTQQATANSNLATLANQIKTKITADTGLTGDAQQAEVATVNADLGKAQAAVSGATNADGINSANDYWTQTLNGDYQAGQALADQQATANSNLGTLAGQVIAKIKADTGLTSAQQTAQVAQVNADLNSAQGAVKSATKADGVNSAVATWTKTLNADYQAGETLTGEQSDAKTKLSLLADQVKNAILADTSLTGATQQAQSSQVDTDLAQALQAVGAAQNADDVNNAVTTWTQTLNGEHKAGQALSTQESTAVNNLTTLAGQVKAAILADTGLTAVEQQAQTKQVEADLAKATVAVNAATNADGINNAVSTWTPTLKGDYQAGQALAAQQKNANSNLATLAGQVQNKIQADTGLTSADQQSQSNQVTNDLSKAQAAVNNATNADGVNSALASWTQSLNGDYHAGQVLSTQQATANANLAILAGQVKNQITADTGLTAARQKSLSNQVDTDLAKAQGAVSATTNADGVNSAATSWTKTLTADYQAGTALADQQATAKSNLAGVADQVTTKIKGDTGLTGVQQQGESNAVSADLAKADSDITNATNADGVNNAVSTWTQTLNGDYQAGQALATQQATASANLKTLADQVQAKITADTGLTSADQQAQSGHLTADLATAQGAVQSATNADGVNAAVATWTQTLNNDYQAGEALTAEQKDANAKLSALSVQVKNAILADTGLTSATQQTQLNQVDHDLGQAIVAIGTSKDDDEVNTVVSAWTQTLDDDYKAGEALSNQQATAEAALTTLAGQVKAKILADTGLTSANQQSQSNQVEKDSAQVQAAVKAATNADGVNSAVTVWTATLNGDYQAGQALATQQASANGQLLTLAGQVKGKILADTGLTTVQQQNQSNQVDRDLTQAQTNVTAATNADGVNSAVATWTKTLNGDYQAGETLAVQQTIANSNLATLANQVKVKIEADTGLTSDQKQAQSNQADADFGRAQAAVNATTNADGVDNEVSTWTKTLNADYQAGEPLSTQQSTANGQMTTLADQVKVKVEADTGLTSAEQQNQSAQVDRDLSRAQGVLNTTTNADGVKNAIATWTQIVSADYQAGEALSAQQSTANSNLATLASQVQAKIAADTGLTTAEQRAQSGQVNADLTQAQSAVNAAQNADAVNGAVATWIKTLNDDYKPGEVLSAQQSTATSNLEILAYQMKAKIAADTGLTGAEQHTQSSQVDTDLTKAEAVVSAATNADGVKNAVSIWTPTLTGDYQAGEALSDQQEAAKSNLATLAEQETAKIAADTGLTSAEQQAQSGQVEADLAKAQAAVTVATNADGVNSAVATWTQTLTGDYHAGQALSTQQATANNNLNGVAGQVKAKILADTGLTSTAQQAQVAQVNQDLSKVQNTVSAATNADGVNNAVATWTQTLNGDYHAGQALSSQQVAATGQLAALVNQVKAKIAGDAGLTSADQQAQSNQVEADLTKAEAAVTAATNADGLDNAVNTWTKTLNADYKAGQAVSAQQAAANANLATLASQIQAKIAADTGLTNAEKQAQSSHVEADLAKAKAAVNAATNADGINGAASIWQQTLNHDYQQGASLSSEQTAANTSLATLADQVKDKILSDTGLTTTQQQAQENQLDHDLAQAQSAVNQDQDDDGVNNALSAWTQSLNADYKAGKALAQQQQSAIANLEAVASQVRAKVAADTGLTSAERQAQSSQVDTDLAKAENAVNAATNADGVNSAVDTWTQSLNGDYHAGVNLDSQKAAASQAIATGAASAKVAIEADKTLTTAQKRAQEDQVDQDQAKAQAAINAATDADATNAARDAGTQAMTNDHQSGASVTDQKAAANQAVATNAVAAKAAIEADKTLTTAQKQAQENQVDQDAAKAQAAINAATDADASNAARDAGIQAMTNDHQPGASIEAQKAAANQAVATNAAAAKAAIEADKTLTTAQKQAQEDQVNQDQAKAQAAINAATDADATNVARAAGSQVVVNDHQPGESIADQKAAADQALANQAAAIKAAIEVDKTLTTAQKQAEENQVNQALVKAQAAINAATDADGIQTNLATDNQQLQKLQDSLTKLTGQESEEKAQSVAVKSASASTQPVVPLQQANLGTERLIISPQLQAVLPVTGQGQTKQSGTVDHTKPVTRVALYDHRKTGVHQNNQSVIKGIIFGLLSISSLLAMTKTYFALDFHRKFIGGKRRKR
ncbi:DUF1542 domain-containing protein [Fructobacillus evanidus]|uniref:DUF1542 domain-containing protein n=1 Tax=Fructobacillus evanidus TaxID=3064281 RepID=UPI002DA41625|nr:Chromosome segregation ATPase Smc (Smc) [Fructobacillus sp. LMG 32999]CAK1243944.1 Chromosome segregation ATPase Smc (Smc) [Fructobacillus sp. LMG 32999]CAK1244285.1 Chromosome segregation ATPase Smc (Smc) [Fructobacillus sp. LMG 32999]